MSLPTNGRGNDSCGIWRGGDVRPLPLDYCCLVYCDFYNTRSMSGVRAMPRRAGEMAVVGAGQTQLWARGREGGGADGGFGVGGVEVG